MNFDQLPSIPAHSWRVPGPDDIVALRRFERACADIDGATHQSTESEWNEKIRDADIAVAAFSEIGEITATGLIENSPGADTERAFLDGRVHPEMRGQGIGSALLKWMENEASRILLALDNERSKVLRIMFWDRTEDAVVLFEQRGYELQYVEEEMRVDLEAPRPILSLPSDLEVKYWSPQNASDFYAVYIDAFTTRTGALLSETDWTRYWANPDDPEFRPDLSFLARDGEQPAAFSVGHVYEPETAYVSQFGVRQGWRRRGLGAGMLSQALDCFAAAGFRYGALSVNVDNPDARRVYERAGFRTAKRLTMYHKVIA